MEGVAVHDLWVVRHGQSAANVAFALAEAEGIAVVVDGRDADVELSDRGRSEAAGLARWFSALPPDGWPDEVIMSPYRRAQQTFEVLERAVAPSGWSPKARVDDRLRDREMGILELMTPAAIADEYPTEAARRRRVGDYYYRPPGGESLVDVRSRVRAALADIEQSSPSRVLVIGHDATVLMARAIIDDLDETGLLDLAATDPVLNASVSHWKRTSTHGWAAQTYNTTSHLAGPGRGNS